MSRKKQQLKCKVKAYASNKVQQLESQLKMATLFSGGSFTKVAQIFQHMDLSCVSLNTFFTHQRHILAALHFNYNLHRDDKVNEDDCVPLNTSYPKFKNGEATVRCQKVEQKFDYVEEPFLLFLGLSKKQLQGAV